MSEVEKKKGQKTIAPTVAVLVQEMVSSTPILKNSHEVALRTHDHLKYVISQKDWNNAQELIDRIKLNILIIDKNRPQFEQPKNIMRQFLKMIREEYEMGLKRKDQDPNMYNDQLSSGHMFSDELNSGPLPDYSQHLPNLRDDLLVRASEYRTELESSMANITSRAQETLFGTEVVMTYGKSTLVEQFLKEAAKERLVHVIVVESSTVSRGHEMAANLANVPNIEVSVIPDVAMFDVMSRTHKVIIGTRLVYADGGLQTAVGVRNLVTTAKYFSVPVVVLTNSFKLTPTFTVNCEDTIGKVFVGPKGLWTSCDTKNFRAEEWSYDYVPPEYIQLFIIAHQNGCPPAYISRLVMEIYHKDDYYIQ